MTGATPAALIGVVLGWLWGSRAACRAINAKAVAAGGVTMLAALSVAAVTDIGRWPYVTAGAAAGAIAWLGFRSMLGKGRIHD